MGKKRDIRITSDYLNFDAQAIKKIQISDNIIPNDINLFFINFPPDIKICYNQFV